jgi:opacity protein-like surface antigen
MLKVKQFSILGVIIILLSQSSYASGKASRVAIRPFLSFQGGGLLPFNLSPAQNFTAIPGNGFSYDYEAPAAQMVGFWGIGLGVEWSLRSEWALQLGLDYLQSSLTPKGTLVQSLNDFPNNYTYQYSVLTRQLLFTGKLLYTFAEHYHPYVSLGLGIASNKAFDYSSNVSSIETTRSYADNTVNSFSYAVGLGAEIDMTSYFRVGAGYRFTDLGRVALGQAMEASQSGFGLPVAGSLSQSHLYANEFFIQGTFIFF